MADSEYKSFVQKLNAARSRGRDGMPPEWGVRGYRSMPTHDGVAYNGQLTLNRKVVAYFENGGTGGPTTIHWDDQAAGADWKKLAAALLVGVSEPEEFLVDCLLDKLGK